MRPAIHNALLIVPLLAVLFPVFTHAGEKSRGLPTPEQIAWHEMELEMFLCLDPCTWQGREYDDHSTPLPAINPADLDTDQWCEVAQSFGAKQILFVAKHTGGFCWWQTETSDYGIRNTPWKNGNGDVLAELAESCRQHGLKLGVYLYPGDDQWGAGIGSGGRTADPAKQEAYNRVLRQQWTEVLTRYGEVSEVWFDGSCVIEVGDILQRHAPQAMVFQGPYATLRWPGNEKGVAPYPTWQTVSREAAASGVSTGKDSDPDGAVWLPMEMDTTLLDHKWFWAPDTNHMMKSLDHLMDIYYTSVGRGCVLLLNATPDTTGRIPDAHVARYREFGATIRRIYEGKKGETGGNGRELTLHFEHPAAVTHIITMEDIRHGHIIRAYQVHGLANGAWQKLVEGTSVGYKRIDCVDTPPVEALRLVVTKAVDTPVIKCFAAYESSAGALPPEQPPEAGRRWKNVSGWDEVALTSEWQTVELDLTPYITTPGHYELALEPQGVEVRNLTPVTAGTPSPRLISALETPHTWLLRRTDQVTPDWHGKTSLRLQVRAAGHGPGKGRLRIRSADRHEE